MVSVPAQTGMLTPHRHFIAFLVFLEVRVYAVLSFLCHRICEIVCYRHIFTNNITFYVLEKVCFNF